ncbi:MAG: hypothetical protein K0S54_2054 [Alphaproteobacteria bacterium]|nr:hypothetical protein [Alphaproteobacteria bacterium]
MSKRIFTTLGLATALGLSAFALSACGGDDDNRTIVQAENTTRGQQLLDLQRAYENGAITRREYEAQRENVLKEK